MAPHDIHDDPDSTENKISVPEELPVLPLRNVVVYPYMVVPITVGQPRSVQLVKEAFAGDRRIAIMAMSKPKEKEPHPGALYQTGVMARIIRLMKAPEGNTHILVQGIERVRVDTWLSEEPYLRAKVHPYPDLISDDEDQVEIQALRMNLIVLFKRLAKVVPNMPEDLTKSVTHTKNMRQLAYLVGSSVRMDLRDAQDILEMPVVTAKMRRLAEIISNELEVQELGKKIQSEAKTEMDRAQKEYFLRQQLKAIQKELGEETEGSRQEEYRNKIDTCGMPEEARKEALRELSRMEKLQEASAEYGVIMTYLDWMTSLPWKSETKDQLDIDHAREVLDEDHYGLKKIKERILEFLAVRQLRERRHEELDDAESGELRASDALRLQREGVILCFVGPPGLGKTSLGQSIARALGRKFHRISLGGLRDEAEIRGHRRTYIGAMPGRFIQALRKLGDRNPLIMLDEIDKVGSDWRGDPSSALLEVLDPEQNREFRDHYLDVAFDLSKVMFIATANVLDSIPAALRDRLEVLHLSGYTDEEKFHIGKDYLLPRQRLENGLREGEIAIDEEALYKIIHDYTRESGVRNLERKLGTMCRKVAVKIASGKEEPVKVSIAELNDMLGKPDFNYDMAERYETPGVATGLAVTSVGGDILFVEVNKMPGKKNFKVTGQLGDVMKESVEAAISLVRSRAEKMELEDDFFEKHDFHIHIPAGATPKDGPSAGVTLVSAMTSLLTGQPVRKEVGMTGEITLRGKVLQVGGIKDKLLAAHRAGLKEVILPQRNEKDLDDIPEVVREDMKIHLVDHIEEVLEIALRP